MYANNKTRPLIILNIHKTKWERHKPHLYVQLLNPLHLSYGSRLFESGHRLITIHIKSMHPSLSICTPFNSLVHIDTLSTRAH